MRMVFCTTAGFALRIPVWCNAALRESLLPLTSKRAAAACRPDAYNVFERTTNLVGLYRVQARHCSLSSTIRVSVTSLPLRALATPML